MAPKLALSGRQSHDNISPPEFRKFSEEALRASEVIRPRSHGAARRRYEILAPAEHVGLPILAEHGALWRLARTRAARSTRGNKRGGAMRDGESRQLLECERWCFPLIY